MCVEFEGNALRLLCGSEFTFDYDGRRPPLIKLDLRRIGCLSNSGLIPVFNTEHHQSTIRLHKIQLSGVDSPPRYQAVADFPIVLIGETTNCCGMCGNVKVDKNNGNNNNIFGQHETLLNKSNSSPAPVGSLNETSLEGLQSHVYLALFQVVNPVYLSVTRRRNALSYTSHSFQGSCVQVDASSTLFAGRFEFLEE